MNFEVFRYCASHSLWIQFIFEVIFNLFQDIDIIFDFKFLALLIWTFFGQRMASHACRVDFLHKRIVQKKFQLKIPTFCKNDCRATWNPNTYQKYDTCNKVRNVQRYQKVCSYFAVIYFYSFGHLPANSVQFLVDLSSSLQFSLSVLTSLWVL